MIVHYHVIRLTQYVNMNTIFYFMKTIQLLKLFHNRSHISSLISSFIKLKCTGICMGFHHATNTYFYNCFMSLLMFINFMNDAHNKYWGRNDIYIVLHLFSYILQKCKRHAVQACVNMKKKLLVKLIEFVYTSTISLTVNKSELCKCLLLL